MRFDSKSHRIVGLACVSLLASCSGLGKNESLTSSQSRRHADGAGAGGLTLKLVDFPQEFQASECAAQAQWRVTLLEGGRESTVLKATMKRGESLKLPSAFAAKSKLRVEIFLGKEERTIFRSEVEAPTASKGLYGVRLTLDKGQAGVTVREGATAPEDSSETALSIWQGTEPSSGTLASTVFLRKEGSMCSGAILCGPDGKIDPEHTWVLTAAHCMTPVYAFFGPEGFSSTRRCTARGPSAANPGYREGSNKHDIAVVQFQCPASALVGAACVRPWTLPLAVGEPLIVAGYGKRSSTLAPGKLMETRATVLAESASAGTSSPYSGVLGGPTGGSLVSRGMASSVCAGDSGGPTYYIRNGARYIAGVHSSGSCDASTPVPTILDAGVAPHADWIFSIIGGSGGHVPGPAQPSMPPTGGAGTASAGGAAGGGQTMVPAGPSNATTKAGSPAEVAGGVPPESGSAPESATDSESGAARQEPPQAAQSCQVPTAK